MSVRFIHHDWLDALSPMEIERWIQRCEVMLATETMSDAEAANIQTLQRLLTDERTKRGNR